MARIVPVLMSGGAGTRLWPLSRKAKPKQFHALVSGRTLIQETALRSQGALFEAPVVICAAEHADLVREQMAAAGIPKVRLVLEPTPRNTAACAVAAAAIVQALDPDAMVLLAPSDHRIADLGAYEAAISAGRAAAVEGKLVVFGLKPERAETGYGYIRAEGGAGLVRPVAEFVEKPDAERAARYAADPAYSWNSGMFLFCARAFLEEARRLAPEVAAAAEASVAEAAPAGDALPLGPSFAKAPSISIDYAIMEKTDKAVVVACDMGWSDVGAWSALWERQQKDVRGNALTGDAIVDDGSGNLVRAEGATVVLAGVSGLVVIVQDGVVLVAPRDRPDAVRDAVEGLRAVKRDDLL